MGFQNEKTPAGETGARADAVSDDDRVNRQPGYTTANTAGSKADNAAERLFKLFVGNEHRHLKSYGPPVWNQEKHKWELNSKTIHRPATLDDWNIHLYPDSGFILSIIPLLDNGTCWFAGIDIDQYDVDRIKICQSIKTSKFPLLSIVSKSGGLHLFVFFKEPVRAERIIPVLNSMAARLGFTKGGYEIFPTSAGEQKLTRGINVPYGNTFNVMPEQDALSATGNSLLLEECLHTIERIRVTENELRTSRRSLSNKSHGKLHWRCKRRLNP